MAKLCSLALAIVMLASANTGGLAQGTALRVGTTPNESGAEAFYAQDTGLFKKAGLDVEVISIGNASLIHSGVVSGSVDIGSISMPPAALAHERGLPYVLVAPGAIYSSKSPASALVVAKNSPIAKAKNLNGRTIGVRDLTNVGSVATEAWIDQNGGDSKSVKYVEVPDSSAIAAVVQGRIDAASIAEPFLDQAVKQGARIVEKYAKVQIAPAMARVTYADALSPDLIQPLIDGRP
jgi:NitT/TauT family transport system substrate-binding protein